MAPRHVSGLVSVVWLVVTAVSEHLKELGIIAGSLYAVAMFLWKTRKRVLARIEKWAQKVADTSLAPLKADIARIDAKIGQNGGGTVHDALFFVKKDTAERFDIVMHRFDAWEEKRDEDVAILGSMSDASSRPSIRFSALAEVLEVNGPFREAFGWTELDLKHGGWRSKLDDSGRRVWDDLIAHMAVFDGRMMIGTRVVPAYVRPLFTERGKFVGWRGTFDAQALKEPS